MNTQKSREESFIGLASSNDLKIALNYKDAFIVLYTSDKYQDSIVMPALFLIRQFLELGLKYNIRVLSKISNSKNLLENLSNTHNLQKLHCSFLDHYNNSKTNLKISKIKDGKMLINLEKLVEIISSFDNNSMGYRYSKDKKGKKQIQLDETSSLKEIYKRVDIIATFFASTEDVFALKEQ